MNMDVIMVGDGCRGVRRVRRGVLGWENDQKGYLGVRMVCRYVCFVCVWPGKFPVCCVWDWDESKGARMIRDG